MLTLRIAAVGFMAVTTGTLICGFQEQEKIQDDTTPFMIRKLDSTRDIVAGLSTENFDLIGKSAQELILLSHEAEWNVLQTDVYLRMSSEFRGSAGRLRKSADEKNLDGATLAYFEVTLNCVRCHKYVRQQRRSGNSDFRGKKSGDESSSNKGKKHEKD